MNTDDNEHEIISQPILMDRRLFSESIDLNRAKFVLSMTTSEIKYRFWEKEAYNEETGMPWEWKHYLMDIRKYLQDICSKETKKDKVISIERHYTYTTGINYGRLYSRKTSIQSLQQRLRNFLCKDKYTDIDIVNCHYSVLLGLVENYNEIVDDEYKLECDFIRCYVKKRNKTMKKRGFKKLDAIMMLNSDNITHHPKTRGYYTKNLFLTAMFEEINNIKDAWLDDARFDKFKKGAKNNKNPKSSFLNKILCEKEAKLVQTVIAGISFKELVLMFDGILINKIPDELQQEFITKINKLTKEPFGHSVEWIIKPIIDDTDFREEDIKKEADNCLLYISKKEVYESTRAYIRSSGYKMYMTDAFGKMVWINMPDAKFMIEGKNQRCINNVGLPSNMALEWTSDEAQKRYDTHAFIPYPPHNPEIERLEDNPLIFNTFGGFDWKWQEQDEPDDKILHTFLYDTISNGCDEKYNHIKMLLAHSVQFPNENPEIATIITDGGLEGTGKDSLVLLWKSIVGQNQCCSTNMMEDIIPKKGSFNMKLKHKLLIHFNEIGGKEGSDYEEQLKDIITRKTNPIRELYTAPYEEKNLARFIMTANGFNPISMKGGPRRWVWYLLDGRRKGDTDYWEEFHSHLQNPTWVEKIGNELLKVKGVQDYFINKKYPETAIMKQYKLINRSKEITFLWNDIIRKVIDEEKIPHEAYIKGDILYILPKTLYNRCLDYCSDEGILLPPFFNATHLTKAMLNIDGIENKKINIKLNQADVKRTTKNYFIINLPIVEEALKPKFNSNGQAQEEIETICLEDGCLTMGEEEEE